MSILGPHTGIDKINKFGKFVFKKKILTVAPGENAKVEDT